MMDLDFSLDITIDGRFLSSDDGMDDFLNELYMISFALMVLE